MEKLSESQRDFLKQAVTEFAGQLPESPAEEHLRERGLLDDDLADATAKFRFGYVGDPLPGFERYQGMLAIPYLRRHPRHGWGCVSIRFRRIGDDGPKYMTMPGDRPRLFNTHALNQPVHAVGITEGEIDAVVGTICGIPTVGVPGAQAWRGHWAELFRGYHTVYVFTDGDDPGAQFGDTVAGHLPNAKIIPAPPGEDLNTILLNQGREAITERLR